MGTAQQTATLSGFAEVRFESPGQLGTSNIQTLSARCFYSLKHVDESFTLLSRTGVLNISCL